MGITADNLHESKESRYRMTNEEWYKYTEKILRSYRRNVESALRVQEELDILRECGDMAGMRYAEGHASGSVDPVLSYVMRAEGLENKLKRIKRRVRAVERLREDLRNGEIRVCQVNCV